MRGLTFFELNNSISMFSLSAICILDKQDSHSLSFKTKLVSVNSCPQNHYGSITLEIVNVKLEKGVRTGLYRTLTSLPSWISKFLVSDNCFVSQKLAHRPQRPWTKTRASAMTLWTGTRASKIKDGENFDVLRSPGSEYFVLIRSKVSDYLLVQN